MHELEDRHYPVEEKTRFQRRTWVIERLGWTALGLIVLAAFSGVFGFGPLSKTSSGDASLSIEYERFQRITHLVQFRVHLAASEAQERQLELDDEFATSYEITDIEPRPMHSSAGGHELQLTFSSKPSEPLTIIIWAHPRSYGAVRLQVRTDGGADVHVAPFVYP